MLSLPYICRPFKLDPIRSHARNRAATASERLPMPIKDVAPPLSQATALSFITTGWGSVSVTGSVALVFLGRLALLTPVARHSSR